jgi:hypothetical protein
MSHAVLPLAEKPYGGAGCGKIDGKREYENKQLETGRQPMHRSRGQIKDP